MNHLIKRLFAGLCILLLLGTLACGDDQPIISDPTQAAQAADPAPATQEEDIVATQGSATPAQALAEAPTPMPTPEPTATPTPFTTRPPIEGDVSTGTFPNYDTGADADWSYQSDELRVAITRVENEDDQIVYYVADVWIRNINSIRMGFGNGQFNSGREEPEAFAEREHAIFAVNGTMNSGLVIHNGEKTKNVENSNIGFRSGIVIIYNDGTVKTINRSKRQSFDYKKENGTHGGIRQAFQFGPILVQDGEVNTSLKKNERHPRTIFGYVEPGHFIFVAVDGRTKKSIGMTEEEMAELMLSLGCTQAMNLDGGNSASMLFMGEVINARSGNDRKVNDMILFAEYDADGNAPALSAVTADKLPGE